jgi:hypothetical protein
MGGVADFAATGASSGMSPSAASSLCHGAGTFLFGVAVCGIVCMCLNISVHRCPAAHHQAGMPGVQVADIPRSAHQDHTRTHPDPCRDRQHPGRAGQGPAESAHPPVSSGNPAWAAHGHGRLWWRLMCGERHRQADSHGIGEVFRQRPGGILPPADVGRPGRFTGLGDWSAS